VRGNKDYLESGWVASDAEAEKVIASYQEQYEAATGGEGGGGGGAAPKKGDASGPSKPKELKGSLRFTICSSVGMGLKARPSTLSKPMALSPVGSVECPVRRACSVLPVCLQIRQPGEQYAQRRLG
jgi:hypothetical protein